jgi:hypothetical protein
VPTLTQTATATLPPTGPVTFTPVADARVEQASPTANFGTASVLMADNSPMIESYLRFTVTGLSGPAQQATLRLWVVDSASNGPAISLCTSTTWSETGITWATKPTISTSRDDKGAIAAGIWVEYDVTPWVTGNGSYCLALIPQSSNGLDLSSKESANPPQLVVTGGALVPTATPPATATLVATATPTATSTPGPTVTPTATRTPTATLASSPTTTRTPTPTPTMPAGPRTFTPAADARVEQASPSANFGTSPTLIADTSPQTETYLRFTVTGQTGPVQSARLRLWVLDPTSNGPPVSSCGSTTWAETGITWSTRPASSGARDDKGTIAAGIWIEYDVTPFVTGNGSVCFALLPQSSNGVDFSSREGSNPPQLVVN